MSRVIVKNIPKNITQYELQEHFSAKGDVTDVKILTTKSGKSRMFAFVGFKHEKDALECTKYFNNTYIRTSKISVEEAKTQGDQSLSRPWSKHSKWAEEQKQKNAKTPVKPTTSVDTKSKIKKLQEISKVTDLKYKFDKAQGINLVEQKNDVSKDQGAAKAEENAEDLEEFDSKRLYIRNLSFQITEEELEQAFIKFGALTEVSVPRDKNKNSFGYGFVCYETTESAVLALEKMDKKIFQGRILHLLPAKAKDVKPTLKIHEVEAANKKSTFKKEKALKLKSEFDKELNWNFLFINQNSVIEAVAKQTGMDKKDVLSRDNSKLIVEVAAMETVIISKTKEWLESQGIDLNTFNNKRLSCLRSKTIILIKNIDISSKEEDIKKLFERYGELTHFMISPLNVMGIAEFIDAKNAENCIKNLSFYEFNGLPLYLEFAPVGLKLKKEEQKQNETSKTEFDEGNVIFANNLSFDTTESKLSEIFKDYPIVSVKIIKNKLKSNKNLSAGYGFVELKTSQDADKALRNLQGTILDSHSIKLSKAKSKIQNEEEETEAKQTMLNMKRKRENEFADIEKEDFDEAKDDKLLVKNIAFEASKDEIRDLFKQFGDVKNVRLPQKVSGDHRGYAFIEFLTHEEAKGAFQKLSNTHFYGRKLVIEWAKKDKSVEDIREETQKKLNTMKIQTHRKMEKGSIN